jgi:matrixin
MNTKQLLLPALCLGGAGLLLAPARSTQAFSKIGGSLGETQRDVRVFDNFLDVTANNNAIPNTQFPGWLGVELAVWKGIVEWGSGLHGDGTGDPQNGNLLGDGAANFDAFWAGNAADIGSTNNNIVSSLSSCGGGGTLAFTETPISDGWRIRFCDNFTWDDGPGTISNRFDVQGVMAHEYGHALGLGHSTVGSATMAPSVGAGSTSIRSIAPDDIAGIQCVYGVASGTKPTIVATIADTGANTLTIHGTNFDASGNEIWFTNENVTAVGVDPIVRVAGVTSTGGGTIITVSIPASAGPGDVIVNKAGSGGATLSNAFPTDLVGTFGTPTATSPTITNVTPASIPALMHGTSETITITGLVLDLTTDVLVDGVPVDAARYTIVDAGTITLDMPQVATLGSHDIGVTDGVDTDEFAVTVVAVAVPTYQLGTGDQLNVVDRDDGMPFIVSGPVGSTMRVVASTSNTASALPGILVLDLGDNFTNIFNGGDFVIPAAGWLEVVVPTSSLVDPGPGGLTFYSQMVKLALPYPLDVSNLQSMILVQ